MLKILPGLIGAASLFGALGVASFASGNDLRSSYMQTAGVAASVNRSAKTDRPASAVISGSKITIHSNATDATSIVVRAAPNNSQLNKKMFGAASKRPVACEAPASVLVEMARNMASGRCVT